MRESKVERDCREIAENAGCWLLKILALNFVGFPDRVFLGHGARIAFLEFKRPKGGVKASAQIRRINMLRRFGFTAEFVDSVEQFKQITGV